MVTKNANVDKAWANVQVQYQRRVDLIPNLVSTVLGAADFEKSTYTQIAALRSQAMSAQKTYNDPASSTDDKVKALGQLESAYSQFKLMVNVENYPQLKATQNFSDLQAQIEGTENRVGKARTDFTEAVTDYNIYIKKFPNNLYASTFGFRERANFSSSAGAEKAPNVGNQMEQHEKDQNAPQ